jgi:hypothetical protein
MIQFTQMQPQNILRMAYNNDVIRFYSDTITTPAYAEVSINDASPIRLYPNPQGRFYCNLMPYIKAMINTTNFEDTTATELSVTDPQSFVYNANNGRYLSAQVTFKVVQSDTVNEVTNTELYWLAATQQHAEFRLLFINDLLVLTPNKPNTLNQWYVKYWEGYPFDVGFYNKSTSLKIEHLGNLHWQDFNSEDVCSRLFLSDGRTDVTLEDFIPLSTGTNNLKLTRQNDGYPYFLTIDKAESCKGVYLKWLNAQGGYSYWLFENTYAVDRTVKDMGELDRDFSNLDSSFGRTSQIGRQSQDTLKLLAELLTPPQRNIVQNLVESPKVFLFTGTPYGKTGYSDWVEVSVKTNSVRIKNPRQELTNFAFDIELPERYVITL